MRTLSLAQGCHVTVYFPRPSTDLGPEDVFLLERCPHFRGCYVQASMELVLEDVSLLERCPHFRGCCVRMYIGSNEQSISLSPVKRSIKRGSRAGLQLSITQ